MTAAREQALSLAFMRAHPAQAAGVLEGLPAAEAAALFAQAPARLGGSVLTAMLPRRAAACLVLLDDARALELLADMPTQPTVALLRQLPASRRHGLIAGLPTASALASTLLLGFGDDTLGAWADPDVLQLPSATRVADALERVRQAADPGPQVFVVDGSRRLAGIVPLGRLLQAPAGATLGGLSQRPAAVLPAHAPLAGTAAHPGWLHSSALPVVEPGEQLVGVMTRDALMRALRRAAPGPVAADVASWPELGARAGWQLVSGLFDASLALLPRVRPVMAEAATAGTEPGAVDGR